MATFDQLAADQRAIIEIVLRQDKSYEQIGEMLDLPPARVRELARDALAELAPHTAEFVDPQWRGQLADYVLGQQTGPEAQATRGHLKRSEPARIWAYSLLDALGDFYGDGSRPEIPVGEAGSRARGRERAAGSNGDTAPASPLAAKPGRGGLSAQAQSALMRRRILGGAGAVVLIALLIFGGIKIFGGDDNNGSKNASNTSTSSTSSTTAQQGQGQVVAQAVLSPIGKSFKGTGAALVYQSGNQALAVVRAKLPPSTGKNKYVLWLYNSNKQLVPLAADVTDKQGNFQGAAGLPNGWQNYRFIDVTYQPTAGKNVGHGRSVMRGPLTAPQQQNGSGGTGTGTGTGTSTTP
ncbi:MAG TPA: sigma factor-like helix-turn-helix DNA-binding protein [Thermoleophilaceae bacterium]|nr:sigma factor-like helix-turn-helix DNA-binding protein [Thermoleophilaceae bacterium]